jgi:hypothetical protein
MEMKNMLVDIFDAKPFELGPTISIWFCGNFKKNDLLICSYQNQHRIVKDKFDGSVVTNILTSN